MNVYAMPLIYPLEHEDITVFPAVLCDDKECILVDCGYPGSLAALESGFNKLGLSTKKLTKVIITHHDHDHVGCLREIEQKYPHVEIFCSSFQLPYLTGKKKSLRVQQAEQELASQELTTDERHLMRSTIEYLLTIEPVHHAQSLPIGLLPWADGIEIIDTKGHMPGHISVYDRHSKTLVAGDALVIEDGKLRCSRPEYTLIMTEALASIKALLTYPIERIICYYGGEYTRDIKNSLESIVYSV